MKHLIRISILTILLLTTGCAHTVKALTPLPIGAVDRVDADANQALQTVHAFLASVSASPATLTPTQLRILDTANKAANTADLAEIAYHKAGGGNASILNAAVAAAESALTTVQASLTASATGK